MGTCRIPVGLIGYWGCGMQAEIRGWGREQAEGQFLLMPSTTTSRTTSTTTFLSGKISFQPQPPMPVFFVDVVVVVDMDGFWGS